MALKIKRVAVLGAGVMGSGIAAHLAGVGLDTLLLDIVPPELTAEDEKNGLTRDHKAFRNKFAASSLKAATKAKPPVFYNNDDAELIEVGNFDDDMARIADCDWIVEAVTERLDIKQSLFTRVDEHRKPGSLVTSNTSGLSIASMIEGRSEDFRRHFFVTHFFNPVRFMRLLELVKGEQTDPTAYQAMADFGADVLGKGIVFGKDTPNFIANRIGIFGMMYTLHAMVRDGYSLEEVDAVFGPASGRPKSAVFRTADMVGLDTLCHVANNCYENLPDDEQRDVFQLPDFLSKMLDKGLLGAKTKAGFYKKQGKEILALDLDSFEYRPREKVTVSATKGIDDVGARIKKLVGGDDRLSRLAWDSTARTLIYSANRLGEIADDVVNIDRAMQWGFNWELGPFEAWDAIGVPESLDRMAREGLEAPAWVTEMVDRGKNAFYSGDAVRPTYYDIKAKDYAPIPIDERQIRLPALKEMGKVVKRNPGATIYDIGDGVLLVEFHTKMNAVDNDIIAALNDAVTMAEEQGLAGVVLGNEDKQAFSAGANLFGVMMLIGQKMWDQLEQLLVDFQNVNYRLRYSDVPVVAAPAGLALGGGAEMTMAADAVRAHAELYMGLVEVGVGLIPAGGGCLCLLERFLADAPDDPGFDPMPLLRGAFQNIAMAKVSVGAEDARKLGMLRLHDRITLNRDLLLQDAKQTVLGLSRAGYRKPRPIKFRLPGADGAAAFRWFLDSMMRGNHITEYEFKMASKLAWVLCGGDTSTRVKVSQQHIMDLEREVFLSLCGEEKTQERIQHMLTKNKPLRN